jgi:hypothetical protein
MLADSVRVYSTTVPRARQPRPPCKIVAENLPLDIKNDCWNTNPAIIFGPLCAQRGIAIPSGNSTLYETPYLAEV